MRKKRDVTGQTKDDRYYQLIGEIRQTLPVYKSKKTDIPI